MSPEFHHGVSEDAGGSCRESWLLLTWWKSQGYIKKAIHINFQVSTFLGCAPSPMYLQSVIMESKRTLEVPDRSLGGFWGTVCPQDTSRKLYIDFQLFTFLKSDPTPGFSRASSKCHPWSLRGGWRFLRGVLDVFDIRDVPNIHPGRSLSIFRALAGWEMRNLLCV